MVGCSASSQTVTDGIRCRTPDANRLLQLRRSEYTTAQYHQSQALADANSQVVGSNIFLSREAPRYPTGYGTSLAFLGAACVVTVILHVLLKRENARRDSMSEDEVRAKYSAEELADMGDKSPLFRYET